jgi:ubiquinone/menaquinone biosynthesis C-methylase UbiE
VLDVGCGEGRHISEACRWECRGVGLDVSRKNAKDAWNLIDHQTRHHEIVGRADLMVVDAQHLPFRDASFDKIVCTEVLEHVPDDNQVIRELVRVLKPGGLIAVSIPNYWPEIFFWNISWRYWHSIGGHVRFYKPGEMEKTLTAAGLNIYAQRLRHTIQGLYWVVCCTFDKKKDAFVTKNVSRLIQWQYRHRLRPLELFEAFLNPVLGKDRIFYARKPD